jgi:hypothetical protein
MQQGRRASCCEKLCRHAREPLDEGVKKDMCCSFACCLSILACSTTNAVAVLPLVLVGAGTCCLVSTTTRVAAVALYGSEAPQQHPHML